MQNFKNLAFAALFIGFLPFASCKKESTTPTGTSTDTNTTNTNKAKVCYPVKIQKDGYNFSDYVYNNSNKVTRINRYDASGVANGYATLEYNSAGKLIKLNEFDQFSANNNYTSYSYNSSGQVIKEVYFNKNTVGTFIDDHYTMIEYSSGKVSKVTNFLSNNGQPVMDTYTTYEYDSRGNVSKEKVYGNDDMMIYEREYTYDDKKSNIYPDVNYGPMKSPNNIIKFNDKNEIGEVMPETSYTSTFSFTAEGMPQKESRTYVDGSPSEVVTSYNCK